MSKTNATTKHKKVARARSRKKPTRPTTALEILGAIEGRLQMLDAADGRVPRTLTEAFVDTVSKARGLWGSCTEQHQRMDRLEDSMARTVESLGKAIEAIRVMREAAPISPPTAAEPLRLRMLKGGLQASAAGKPTPSGPKLRAL